MYFMDSRIQGCNKKCFFFFKFKKNICIKRNYVLGHYWYKSRSTDIHKAESVVGFILHDDFRCCIGTYTIKMKSRLNLRLEKRFSHHYTIMVIFCMYHVVPITVKCYIRPKAFFFFFLLFTLYANKMQTCVRVSCILNTCSLSYSFLYTHKRIL